MTTLYPHSLKLGTSISLYSFWMTSQLTKSNKNKCKSSSYLIFKKKKISLFLWKEGVLLSYKIILLVLFRFLFLFLKSFYCSYGFDHCIWFWFVCQGNWKKRIWNNKHFIITIFRVIEEIAIVVYLVLFRQK